MAILPFGRGLAMDLGTANTLIYERGRGIVLNEPSMVLRDKNSGKILTAGRDAKDYLGRTPVNLEVLRPLRAGAISDFSTTQAMIRHFLHAAGSSRGLFKSKILVGVPIGITQIEKRAIMEAAEGAGAKSVHLVDEPLAAAIGLGLPVGEPLGQLILDVGGGTSEGVITSLGAISASESRRVAGDTATEAIAMRLQRKYQIAVGENMAERIKMTIGSAMPLEELPSFPCRGKDMASGIPRVVEVAAEDIHEALEEIIVEFIDMVRRLLGQAPPELAADFVRHGVHLTGGGALLKGLARRLAAETGLEVHPPEDPLVSVIMGLGYILEDVKHYKKIFAN